jgi:hypothetical protein
MREERHAACYCRGPETIMKSTLLLSLLFSLVFTGCVPALAVGAAVGAKDADRQARNDTTVTESDDSQGATYEISCTRNPDYCSDRATELCTASWDGDQDPRSTSDVLHDPLAGRWAMNIRCKAPAGGTAAPASSSL